MVNFSLFVQVHERSRDREFSRLQETHEAAIRELKDYHVKEIEAVKTEAHEVKQVAEERLRIELKVSLRIVDEDLHQQLHFTAL